MSKFTIKGDVSKNEITVYNDELGTSERIEMCMGDSIHSSMGYFDSQSDSKEAVFALPDSQEVSNQVYYYVD